jgi:hypothetical protein
MKFNKYKLLERFLYFGGLLIIFLIDWRYAAATIIMIIADNMKTHRMFKEDAAKSKVFDNNEPYGK